MSRRSTASCEKCAVGYCAPLRCYCGHTECHAYASYVDARAHTAHDMPQATASVTSWAEREHETWLDKM